MEEWRLVTKKSQTCHEKVFFRRAMIVIAISIGLLVALYFTVRARNDAQMEAELGKAVLKAMETIVDIKGQLDENRLDATAVVQQATPFNLIDTETMTVVSYPKVSEGYDATVFLFW